MPNVECYLFCRFRIRSTFLIFNCTTTTTMNQWNCCRTCLAVKSLRPFISIRNRNDNTEALSTAIGLKIQQNDALPQEICLACFNTVTKIMSFQKVCKESHKALMEQLHNKYVNITIKIEPDNGLNIDHKTAKTLDYNDDNDFFDTTDFSRTDNTPIKKSENDLIEFESTVEDILKKGLKFDFENLKPECKVKKNIPKLMHEDIKPVNNKGMMTLDNEFKQDENNTEKSKIEKEGINSKNMVKPFECEHCHKVLKSKFSYVSHLKIHTAMRKICEHCGKQFLDKRRLLMHCKAKHGYQKTDKCSYCNWAGTSAEAVKIHERLHTGEKPYVCEICSASFNRQSSYLQHKPIHLLEKTVQCDQCPALFKSVTLMRIHKTRHKPREYKHKCLVCCSYFSKRWHCLRHLQRIHGLREALDVHVARVRLTDIEK